MNMPNGLWVRGDGTVYVLDTGNGKVRRLDTNGLMTTLFTDGKRHQRRTGVVGEELMNRLFTMRRETDLMQWTPSGGSLKLEQTIQRPRQHHHQRHQYRCHRPE